MDVDDRRSFPDPEEPVKVEDVWGFNSSTNSSEINSKAFTNTGVTTHSNLEIQRANLETRIGVEALLKVYNLVLELEQKNDDDKLDCTDFQQILGSGNEDLIDDIIQLVVADQFFNINQK